MTDPQLGLSAIDCGATTSLVPGATVTCTATYTVTLADVDAGSISNTGTVDGSTSARSTDHDTRHRSPPPRPALTSSSRRPDRRPTTSRAAGDVITYSYLVTNTGNVTITGPFTVTDNRRHGEPCPATTSLVPGASITCTRDLRRHPGRRQRRLGRQHGHRSATFSAGRRGHRPATDRHRDPDASPRPIVKTSSTTTATHGGDTITYSYVLTNTGNVTLTARSRSLTTRPPRLSCPATTSLAPGASISCTATYTVTQADLDAGSVNNTATGDGRPAGRSLERPTRPTGHRHPGAASISSSRRSTTTTATGAGDTITYSYHVTNTGNVTVTGFSVTDPHTGLSPIDCGTTTSLAPNADVTCTATYVVTQADLDAGRIDNTGTVDGTTTAATGHRHRPTVSRARRPALTLVKTTRRPGTPRSATRSTTATCSPTAATSPSRVRSRSPTTPATVSRRPRRPAWPPAPRSPAPRPTRSPRPTSTPAR